MLLTVALLCASLSLQGTGVGRASSDASQPDQVIQWNRTLLQILQTPGAQPATIHPTRSLAIVHLAIYDAVNAIRGGHAPYLVLHAPRSASPDCRSGGSGAHRPAFPLPEPEVGDRREVRDSLSQIGSGAHVRQGIRVGEEAANAILAARANDGSDSTPPMFVPQSGPGEYQLTPPNFKQPVFTNWPDVRPFVLESGDQFRPPPPPAVTSPRYTTDFNEIKSLGEIKSTTRSADQTDIGRFWGAAPVQNVWNQIAQTAGMSFDNSLEQNARLFALLDTSLADGVIALYDSKYAYHRWRPVTASRRPTTTATRTRRAIPTGPRWR